MNDTPLVSVAIPLYRSKPFVEVIAANIAALSYPNLEILISDRHGADDGFQALQKRFCGDRRVRFLQRHDELDWIDHYNDLLQTARGVYFMWMPHDDLFPPGYVDSLAAALDAAPEMLVAFGVMESESVTRPVGSRFTPPPMAAGAWSSRASLRLLMSWNLGFAFRGLIRRDPIVRRRLWIRRTWGSVGADVYWLFGVSLLGKLAFVPGVKCVKRYYADSAHANWRSGPLQAVDALRVTSAYLWASDVPLRQALWGQVVLGYVAGLRVAWRTLRLVRISARNAGDSSIRSRSSA